MYPKSLPAILAIIFLFASCNQKANDKTVRGGTLASINAQISSNPGNADLYVKRADYYLKAQQLQNALNDLQKAIKLKPDHFEAHLGLSGVFLLMGKPQDALDQLNICLSLNPSSVEALVKKARLYLIMKDYENCAATVSRIHELDPGNAEAYFIKGEALEEYGETEKAADAYRLAVNENPKHTQALLHLGYIYADKNPDMAAGYFNNALKSNPGNTEALYNLGMIYQETGKYQQALDAYSEMLKSNPKDKLALYNSGYVNLVYLQEFEKAAVFFSQAISVDETYTDAYFNRGLAYELAGKTNEAVADYKKVLSLNPDYRKAADALKKLGK